MTLKIYQKMAIIMVVFFMIPFVMFLDSSYTASEQKDDGLVINLAGRQRMLSQKMSKECLTYLHLVMMNDKNAERSKSNLLNSMEAFETTLVALIESGKAPLSLDLNGGKRSVPAATGETLTQLEKVRGLWIPFKVALMRSITTHKEEDILAVLEQNIPLLKEMDLAVSMMQQGAEQKVLNLFWFQVVCQVVGLVIVLLVVFWTRKNLVQPIIDCVAFSRTLSEGDLQGTVSISQKDELGTLGSTLNLIVEKFSGMIHRINANVETLNNSSLEMNEVANEMANVADTTVGQANTVASAAEETDSAMNSIAAAMEQASTNVDTVASATEEMSISISNITNQTSDASESVRNAVDQAQQALTQVAELGKAAEEIGMVSETITSISDKTALLALNATIEAARAGDAGKGFAVVANEIKELAQQTAFATGDIAGKLHDVQQLTDQTVLLIKDITDMVETVSLVIFGIDESVEQQSAATKEITQNIVQTSQGLKEITANVTQTKSATGQVAQEITEVNESADQLSNTGAQVQRTSIRLNELSEQIQQQLSQFQINSESV